MSNAIFPTLAGATWETVKTPVFSTSIQKAASGRETRVAYMSAPMYKFQISHEFLRDKSGVTSPALPYNEFKSLFGFYMARRGSFDSFLFNDTTDNSVTDQVFGIGDGTTRTFQLGRSIGSQFYEGIENVNGSITVKKNGTTTTAYTVGQTGIVTFTFAPENGETLTWSGSYYYRVRFDSDELDFTNFMQELWEQGGLTLYGSLQNRV